MSCESTLQGLPNLREFVKDSNPHDLPPVWGLGDGPTTPGPDLPTVHGLERLLGSIAEPTKGRVFDGMRHESSGFWSGVSQLAFGSTVEAVSGSCRFEAPCINHPVDVVSEWEGRVVHAEVKFWDWPGCVPNGGLWTEPISAPGIEEAAELVYGREFERGNQRAPGRGRTTQMRQHFEEAGYQLLANDPDHQAVRIAVVVTRWEKPGAYFENVLRGEVMYLVDEGALHEIRPFETHTDLEPTGLANRLFASEIDIALWFSFSPVMGFRGALVTSGEEETVANLGRALTNELEARRASA